MKPAGYLYFSENIACHCTSEDADEMTISVGTPYYTADQLRQAQVNVLQLAAQRFRGDVGYNPVAAEGYANAFDIAAELDYMADEIERSKT